MGRTITTVAARAAVCGVLAAVCGALAAVCGALAAPASAAWTRPVQISAPTSIDVLGPQVAVSQTGASAVSFNETNIDIQAIAGAYAALAGRGGAFGAAGAVPGVQEVLAIAYSGSTLELLTASAPPGQPCCTTVQVIRRRPRSGFGRPQTLVTNVGGGTTGSLVPLANGRTLAVIAGPQRLWVTEAPGAGRFAPVRGLTRPGFAPSALAVTGTTGGGSAVVWTQGSGQQVFGASAGPGRTPSRGRTLLTVRAGHVVDGLQLVARASGLTIGWTESSSDATGGFRSRVMAADLTGFGRRVRGRALSAAPDVASALTLASDGNGAEVAAWEACTPSGCEVQSTMRRDGTARARRGKARRPRPRARWFGAPSNLGPIDPEVSPQLAMAADRKAVIGWITGGRVALAASGSGAKRFGALHRGLSGGVAANLALGIGPTGKAAAAWSEGTFAPAVFVTRGG